MTAAKTPPLALRPMTSLDYPQVLAIERTLAEPWRAAHLDQVRRDKTLFATVAAGGKGAVVAGYLVYRLVDEDLVLRRLAVRVDWRRRGVARSLVAPLLQSMRERRLPRLRALVPEHALDVQLLLRACGFWCTQTMRSACGETDGLVFEAKP